MLDHARHVVHQYGPFSGRKRRCRRTWWNLGRPEPRGAPSPLVDLFCPEHRKVLCCPMHPHRPTFVRAVLTASLLLTLVASPTASAQEAVEEPAGDAADSVEAPVMVDQSL